MHSDDDTIAAIGTAPGEAGISIVRISGPDAFNVSDRVFRTTGAPPSRRPGGTFVHGFTHDPDGDIDEVLLLVMRAPRSYTRQHMVEIQGHGGEHCARRNLRVVLDAGARLAEPGEFTKRAFLNGRLDLLQAEAVLDLIKARSERAASAALEQLEGSLSREFNAVYDDTLAVAADLEATLDFPDDELPPAALPEINRRLTRIRTVFDQLIDTWDEGHLLREGARVVIAGRPNVGKSTMLNTLLDHDRAIVSSIPGTTRDSIEEGFVLGGIPLLLVDTAGLRITQDLLESEGIRRTQSHLEKADIYLYVIDGSVTIADEDLRYLEVADAARSVVALNKVDLGLAVNPADIKAAKVVQTSLLQGVGVEDLKAALADLLRREIRVAPEPRAVISERHRRILLEAGDCLHQALGMLDQGREETVVLAAARLRTTLELMGTATGRHYHDELLTSIFSRFCIGK